MLKHAKVNYFVQFDKSEDQIFPTLFVKGKSIEGIDALRELSVHLDYIEKGSDNELKKLTFASWKDYPDYDDEKVISFLIESRKSDEPELAREFFEFLKDRKMDPYFSGKKLTLADFCLAAFWLETPKLSIPEELKHYFSHLNSKLNLNLTP